MTYRTRVAADRHLGLCLEEPFGAAGAGAGPGQGDGDLPWRTATVRERWLDRVTHRLPRLERRTTVQAAPSDFCLADADADGALVCNLMEDDPWPALAAIVTERFSSSCDRLVAAMALVGQKSVTNLILSPMFFDAAGTQHYHSALHELIGPLSILRYGGGPAASRAVVPARLLQALEDPQTGAPFVTRLVQLGRGGGPRPVRRRYTASANLAPCGQHPERIAAVAVETPSGMTLLDPTSLTFFPRADDTAMAGPLLTIDALPHQALALRAGAGRLATCYGQIDLDELRRVPTNRTYSKGVFPDLCPDEVEVAGADTTRERQEPRVMRAEKEVATAHSGGLRTASGAPGQRDAELEVCWDDQSLTVSIFVTGRSLQSVADMDAKDRSCEAVHLLLDGDHDHYHFHHLRVGLDGTRGRWLEHSASIQRLFKNLATENWVEEAELPDASWDAVVELRDDGYLVRCTIPWSSLGGVGQGSPRPGPVVGINLWIDSRYPCYEQVFLCPPRFRLPADAFSFADLYLTDRGDSVAVTEIDFGVPTWGMNEGRLRLANAADHDLVVTIDCQCRLSMRRAVRALPPVSAVVPARGQCFVPVPFFVDPEEKMTSGRAQEIVLRVLTENITVYAGRWMIGYCGPLNVYARFGADLGDCPDPAFGEADYVAKKQAYICSRIPSFRRRTTREGAASDFVLAAPGVEIDLMRPGALERVALYITGLFDNDLDRVLGLFYFSVMPAVLRHQSAGHRIMQGAGPLSIIRGNHAGGGGNCGFHALAFAGLMAHLTIQGQRLVAHTVDVWGHCIAAIGWRGSKALLDSDVGQVMYTADGSDLATIEEVRADPDVLTAAGPGERVRYYTFNDWAVAAAGSVAEHRGSGVFPPGAPEE